MIVVILLAAELGSEEPLPSVDAIMAHVAENRSRAERLRSEYIYKQKLLIRLRDGRGKLVRETEQRKS